MRYIDTKLTPNTFKRTFIGEQTFQEKFGFVRFDKGDVVYYKIDPKTNLLMYHREDGPAIEWSNGDREWWIDGKSHRENGPALILKVNYKAWTYKDYLVAESDDICPIRFLVHNITTDEIKHFAFKQVYLLNKEVK